MKYEQFIQQLKQQPKNREPFIDPYDADNSALRSHRDQVVEQIVNRAEQLRILHEASELESLLEAAGIQLKIEEEHAMEQDQIRMTVIFNHQQQEKNISYSLNWVDAQVASYRILTAFIEQQMQQHMIALQSIEKTLHTLSPDMQQFITSHPEIDLLLFSQRLCLLSQSFILDADLRQDIHDLRNTEPNSPEHLQIFTRIKEKLSQIFSLPNNSPEYDMWLDFFISTDPSAILNSTNTIQNLESLNEQASSVSFQHREESRQSFSPPAI